MYLSRYINQNKNDYYRLLQSVRDTQNWEEWVLFMLKAIEKTSIHTIEIVKNIKTIMPNGPIGLAVRIQLCVDYKQLGDTEKLKNMCKESIKEYPDKEKIFRKLSGETGTPK